MVRRGLIAIVIALACGLVAVARERLSNSHDDRAVSPKLQAVQNAANGDRTALPEGSIERLVAAAQDIEAAIRSLLTAEDPQAHQIAEQCAEAERRAQEDMAFWTMVLAKVTIVSVFATVTGIFFVWCTLREARRANAIANAAVEATVQMARDQAQAYVHVEGIDFYIGDAGQPPAPGRKRPRFVAWVRNSGKTPAKWCCVVGSVRIVPTDWTYPFEIESDADTIGSTSGVIPGGEAVAVPMFTDADAIEEAYPRREGYMVILSGIVRYETFFSERFETQFMFVASPIPAKVRKSQFSAFAERDCGREIFKEYNEIPTKLQSAHRPLPAYQRVE